MSSVYANVIVRTHVIAKINNRDRIVEDFVISKILDVSDSPRPFPRAKVSAGFTYARLHCARFQNGLARFTFEFPARPITRPSEYCAPAVIADEENEKAIEKIAAAGFMLDTESHDLACSYAKMRLSDFNFVRSFAHKQWLELVRARLDREAEERVRAMRKADAEREAAEREARRRKLLAEVAELQRQIKAAESGKRIEVAKQKLKSSRKEGRQVTFDELALMFS
jgi:hypothetical protein